MASTRMAFGAIMGTITNTASAVSDLANTVGDSVGMLNKFVESASIDQRERHVVHRTTFREQLIREASMEIAKGDAETLVFCKESEENKQLFENAQSKLLAAFDNFDGKKS